MTDPGQSTHRCTVCGQPPRQVAIRAPLTCSNCYRRQRREDGRYNYERREGKRAEQKRAWDDANGHGKRRAAGE